MCHPPNEISDNLVVQSICKRKSPRQLINTTFFSQFVQADRRHRCAALRRAAAADVQQAAVAADFYYYINK